MFTFLVVLRMLIVHWIFYYSGECLTPYLLQCSLLALSPDDVLPAIYLCTNKISPDHENMVSTEILYFTSCPHLLFYPLIFKALFVMRKSSRNFGGKEPTITRNEVSKKFLWECV